MRKIYYRLATFFLVLFISICINFFLPRMMPGNPIDAMLARMEQMGKFKGRDDLVEFYKKQFNLEGTMLDQFLAYIVQLMQGNLGFSLAHFPATVADLIMVSLPYSLFLMITGLAISWTLGTLIGGIVGWKAEKSKWSLLLTAISVVFNNMPYFIVGLIFLFLFSYSLRLFPISGAHSPTIAPSFSLAYILDFLYHSVGPISVVVISQLAMWFLHMRGLVIDVKNEDFMLYAEAKGLSDRRMLMSYVIRNCLLSQVTELGMALGWVFSGSLLAEVVFSYPGMGTLLFDSILNLDYPVIMGIMLLVILTINTILLLLDVLILPLIDPRTKEE
ncbi:MAG: ABC transporter permease [Candidatus Bathyarchaeia archaeon]